MLATLLLFAQEHARGDASKTPFYVAASALVAFALMLSAIGIRRHETFPPSKAVGRPHPASARCSSRATMFTAVITG